MFTKVKSIFKVLRPERSSHLENSPSSNNIKFDSIDSSINLHAQHRESNEEDLTIVWINRHANTIEMKSLMGSTRSINDYIQIFDDELEAMQYIESISEEKILLIVDEYPKQLQEDFERLKTIKGMIIYPSKSLDHLPYICCSNEKELLHQIDNLREELNEEMPIFSIYNPRKTEKNSFNHETSSFLFFQLFKSALKTLPKNSESKKFFISKYRTYYAGNSEICKELEQFGANSRSPSALQWYLNDSFLTRLINKALRTENINSLCSLHFYIVDLSKELEKQFDKFRKENSKGNFQVYRAFQIPEDQLKIFEDNIGCLILTNGYLTTTRDRQLALNGIQQRTKRIQHEKVLFQYTVDLTQVKSIIFADVSSFNRSSEKDHILFDLGTTFKIHSCRYNDQENLWLVQVHATDEGNGIASEYMEYQKAKMSESDPMLMLGHLIIETGDYDKAEKYFNGLLHSSIPNDEQIACIYYNIGRVYRLKEDYHRAIEYLNRAFVQHSQARPARLVSAAKTMNAIGILFMQLNNVQQAIESFESALKYYSKTIQTDHPDVAGTLINLANIYCEHEQYDIALSSFKRAEKIYQTYLPPTHPNMASLLNNIGNLYYQQGNYDLALDAYQRALNINEKILSPSHPILARNRHCLARIHVLLGDQMKAQLQLKRASECPSYNINVFNQSDNLNVSSWERSFINDPSNIELTEMKRN